MEAPLHLSVVAASRNDDHGGGLLKRMQHFVDGFVAQCRRHTLEAELILVEWNPPPGTPGLQETLRWPRDLGNCVIRIVTVPRELHAQFDHSEKLPLFQFIAKNVGIRRARGTFVLATNIDILFSDEIVRYMRDRLRPGRVYRVDRYDVPSDLPTGTTFSEVLEYCNKNFFRVHTHFGNFLVKEGRLAEDIDKLASAYCRVKLPRPGQVEQFGSRKSIKSRLVAGGTLFWKLPGAAMRGVKIMGPWDLRHLPQTLGTIRNLVYARFLKPLHLMACGDFTLMSREDWFKLRGYPEWATFAMHVDSILLYAAVYSGIRHTELGSPNRIYHIEHATGSGWTPEGHNALFDRLRSAGIPYLTNEDLTAMAEKMARDPDARVLNDEKWGFALVKLREAVLGDDGKQVHAAS